MVNTLTLFLIMIARLSHLIDVAKVHKKMAQKWLFFDFSLIFLELLKCKKLFLLETSSF